MGQKPKIGQQRKDRYYHLAKETGYRSRAAFKLIQLNRKFEFLQKSRVCIDLCAAPGGWMQVAKEAMPVSSIVVGVDLTFIKPVPGCMSIKADITTDNCRVELQKALQSWKADAVLNDGAPNVGMNWLYDAYQQSTITLSALKIATQFLRRGGWFVTKIFRSKDYNSLLWVFKQLFKKVHATKPQASRTESAEIFVVCQYYLAPDKLDSRFLDPKYVFDEIQMDPISRLNVFHPEKQKKIKAEGYSEDSILYKMPVSEFLAAEDDVAALQKATEIVLDDATVANDPLTTAEIKECCKDIRVLGRKDLRVLLSWKKNISAQKREREGKKMNDIQSAIESDHKVDDKNVDEEEEEEDDLDNEVAQLEQQEMEDSRRQRKKVNKTRKKLQTQLDLKMVLKGDPGPRVEEFDLFDLKNIPGQKGLEVVSEQRPDVLAESDVDSDMEKGPRIVTYEKDGPSHLHSSGTHYTEEDSESEKEEEDEDDTMLKDGLGLEIDDGDDEEETNPKNAPKPVPANPLITDLDHRSRKEKLLHKASLWFEKDVFNDMLNDDYEDADLELEKIEGKLGVNVGKPIKKNRQDKENDDIHKSGILKSNAQKKVKRKNSETNEDDDWEDDLDDTKTDKKDRKKKMKGSLNNANKDGFEVVAKNTVPVETYKKQMNAESLALGAMMVTSKRMKREILDAGWNRYAFNDTDLPDWFVADEEKVKNLSSLVPPELVEEYSKRETEINVRPIKKVIEAKARKKKRMLKNLEKAKKKVGTIMENVDISNRDKARQIKRLYKKARDPKKPEVTYVVSKKSMAGKRMRRPLGIKGPYKVVDPRMKKDNRKTKLADKQKKKGKGKTKGPRGRRERKQREDVKERVPQRNRRK